MSEYEPMPFDVYGGLTLGRDGLQQGGGGALAEAEREGGLLSYGTVGASYVPAVALALGTALLPLVLHLLLSSGLLSRLCGLRAALLRARGGGRGEGQAASAAGDQQAASPSNFGRAHSIKLAQQQVTAEAGDLASQAAAAIEAELLAEEAAEAAEWQAVELAESAARGDVGGLNLRLGGFKQKTIRRVAKQARQRALVAADRAQVRGMRVTHSSI
jgi:hypothetical protein